MTSSDKETNLNLQNKGVEEGENGMPKKHTNPPEQPNKDNHSFEKKNQHYPKSSKQTKYYKKPDMRHEPTKDKISVISEQELVEKQKAPEKPRICANGKNCIFYPHCKFEHPPGTIPDRKPVKKQEVPVKPKICANGKNCKFYPKCNFEHPPGTIPDCRFADHCTREGCLFEHPPGYIPGVSPISNPKSNIKIEPRITPYTNKEYNQDLELGTIPVVNPVSNLDYKVVSTFAPKIVPIPDTGIELIPEQNIVHAPIFQPNQQKFSEELYIINRIIKNTKYCDVISHFYNKINEHIRNNNPYDVVSILIDNLEDFTVQLFKNLIVIKEYLELRKQELHQISEVYDSFICQINNIETFYNKIINITINTDYIIVFDIFIRKFIFFIDSYDEIINKYNNTYINDVKLDETQQKLSCDII